MSASPHTAAPAWSSHQRAVLGTLGYTLECYRPTLPANRRAALELDADAVDAPLVRALLIATGLDGESARREPLDNARLRLVWDQPGRTVVLPSLSALRQGALKRSLWPQLRALRRERNTT